MSHIQLIRCFGWLHWQVHSVLPTIRGGVFRIVRTENMAQRRVSFLIPKQNWRELISRSYRTPWQLVVVNVETRTQLALLWVQCGACESVGIKHQSIFDKIHLMDFSCKVCLCWNVCLCAPHNNDCYYLLRLLFTCLRVWFASVLEDSCAYISSDGSFYKYQTVLEICDILALRIGCKNVSTPIFI